MINKAFETVENKLFKALQSQDFKKVKAESSSDNELVSLFTGNQVAYNLVYYKDKKYMVLRSCDMTDEGPDNEWKTVSTWMFDPETDTLKEAENIGNDFAETVGAGTSKAIANKQARRKKKGEDGNGDPIFFVKRLVTVFPELKDEIKYEEENYFPFRAVTFAREKIVPKVNALLSSNDKKQISKLGEILSNQYSYGNLDVRSVITIVILNGIDERYNESFSETLSEDLKKAWQCAAKYKNKKVKPEKPKKPKSNFLAETLSASR